MGAASVKNKTCLKVHKVAIAEHESDKLTKHVSRAICDKNHVDTGTQMEKIGSAGL